MRARTTLLPVLLFGLALAPGCADPDGAAPAVAVSRSAPASLAPLPDSQWARLVVELSEPGGYFDTDNLISNEAGYLHVMGALDRLGVGGGAYIGVGPDQNYSYIARVRPEIAFLVDIRRDNLLQHLLFRALFEASETRVEYLSLLHGHRAPDDAAAWTGAGPDELVAWILEAPGGPGSAEAEAARGVVADRLEASPLELAPADLATVRRFHDAFIRQGPGLRFTSFGRAPRPYYPTFARLVTARDLEGRQASYLASEESWTRVKALHEANRIVPVVGDLAGDHALGAIGDEVRRRGLEVSLLYASNVEFYLWGDGTFDRFAANVADLPVARNGVLVRSYFPNFGRRHPHADPASFATQTLQTLESFQEARERGGYASYWETVSADAVDPGGEEGG